MLDETAIALAAFSAATSLGSCAYTCVKEHTKKKQKSSIKLTTEHSESMLPAAAELEEIIVMPSSHSPVEKARSPSPFSPMHVRTKMSFEFLDSSKAEKQMQSSQGQNNINKSNFSPLAHGNPLSKSTADFSQLNLNQNQKMADAMNFAVDIMKAHSPNSSPVMRAKNTKASTGSSFVKAESKEQLYKDIETFNPHKHTSLETHIDIDDIEEMNLSGSGSDDYSEFNS